MQTINLLFLLLLSGRRWFGHARHSRIDQVVERRGSSGRVPGRDDGAPVVEEGGLASRHHELTADAADGRGPR